MQLSGVIKHSIQEGKTIVGRQESRHNSTAALATMSKNSILLAGATIQEKHAVINRKGQDVTIEPASPAAQV
jgi:hypothetical protein